MRHSAGQRRTRAGRPVRGGAALAALLAMGGVAWAAPAPLPCTPGEAEPATVKAIGEDLALTLSDGRLVRLAGIDFARATATHPGLGDAARAMLVPWLIGNTVLVRTLDDTVDRWGRRPALVFADPPPGGGGEAVGDGLSRSAALTLLSAGLARVRPEPVARACADMALAAEASARAAGLGLWADPYYAIRAADDLPALSALAGSMAIVEGRIAHMGQSRAQVFLDLGPPHAAVALRLGRRAPFILDQLGLGQSDVVGARVRVRGIVDMRGEPRIDIEDADQIVRLDGDAPATRAP